MLLKQFFVNNTPFILHANIHYDKYEYINQTMFPNTVCNRGYIIILNVDLSFQAIKIRINIGVCKDQNQLRM